MPRTNLLSQPLPRDPVIDAYMRDVDRTLIRAQLQRTYEERIEGLLSMLRFYDICQKALPPRCAAGRPKDDTAVSELQAILEEQQQAEENQ